VFRLTGKLSSLVIILILIFNQVEGDGTILANTIIFNNNQNQLAPLAAVPAVGTILSPTIDTQNLSHQMVLRIVQYYNQSFNIQPADTVGTRSQKIINWLRSEM
jgi:hypothetical protein